MMMVMIIECERKWFEPALNIESPKPGFADRFKVFTMQVDTFAWLLFLDPSGNVGQESGGFSLDPPSGTRDFFPEDSLR